jgi:hypothetical protein
MQIRKILTIAEESFCEAGQPAGEPLRKVAVVAIVRNRHAGAPFASDLSEDMRLGADLGTRLGKLGVEAMRPHRIESYGKGAVVGIAGEQEHGVAFLTTIFGDALRVAVGGGKAWISSSTKRAATGATIDVPLAYKDALYVRSHYDAMTIHLPDAPLPDEIAVIACFANRGRLNDRVGGARTTEVIGLDGLR